MVARRPRRTSPTHLALLRLDLEALLRGRVEGDELCEITGLGPVPVRVARQFLGDAVLKLVLTRGVDVANVTHLGRGPSGAQRTAMLWSSPTCVVQGCNAVRTEADHRIPWAQSRHTRLDELDALCGHHHDLKTYEGWALVAGTGRRPMVAPDDPRHPGHGPPAGSGRAPPAGEGTRPPPTLFGA
ncbi:MAG: HNH endonuclease signature motif containing protein [Acidimicrobiales bacterium]